MLKLATSRGTLKVVDHFHHFYIKLKLAKQKRVIIMSIKQILFIVVLFTSSVMTFAKEVEVIPSMPVAIGARASDNSGGFHFDMKAGPSVYIDPNKKNARYDDRNPTLYLLPFVGIHYVGKNEGYLMSGGGQITVAEVNHMDMCTSISAEVVTSSLNESQPGYRIGTKMGFFNVVTVEVAFQNYQSKELQLNLTFDALLMISELF